jgi:hypothetical protein
MVFTNAYGLPLSGTPPARPPSGDRQPPSGTWTHPTGERLQTRWVHFPATDDATPPR